MTDEHIYTALYTKNIYALVGPIFYGEPAETAPTCYVSAAGIAYAYADFARLTNHNDNVILMVFDMLHGESVEDCLELNSEALGLALLREDINSYYQWLEFSGQPDETTRAALQAAGWDCSPGRVQWFHQSYLGRVPAGVSYLYAGECAHVSGQAEHLQAGAASTVEHAQEQKDHPERAEELASRWHRMNTRPHRAIVQRLEVLRGDQSRHQTLLDQARATEKGPEVEEEERCMLIIERHIERLQAELEALGGSQTVKEAREEE